LGEKIKDEYFSHKFLMCLPKKFKLTGVTPNEVLGDVMTDTQHNDSDNKEVEMKDDDKKKKSMAFKASTSSKSKDKAKKEASNEDEDASDINDEAMTLLVRKMGKFIKKRGYGVRKRRDHMKEHVRLCYKCKSPDHIVVDCPYNSDNEEDEKEEEEKKEKKITFKKKKKESGYVVTWDSDCNEDSDDDDSSDDDKKPIKKALASIAIHNKPSLFDTLSTYLMVKPTKVKYEESDDECESNDYRSDDEENYSKEELIDMCDQLSSSFEKKRKECKALQKELKALKPSFGKLQASHECLKEDHEELGLAHIKLKKAHSSLLEQVKMEETKKEAIVTCDKGSTCDLINESFLEPIIVAFTNPSCSTFTFTSSTSDGFTCDTSQMVENETLKKEVNELTRALGNTYGGEDRLLICLGSQRASLNKEGLGYISRKSKTVFAPHKTNFVKNNGHYCISCKQVGHIERDCKNKRTHANVSSIKFDSC
jgi:flagellar hook-length control protein FliK